MMLTFFHAISSLRLEDQFWSDTNFRVPSSHRSARRIEADSSHELPETFRFSIPSLRGGYKGQVAPRASTRPWNGCFTVNHLNQAWKEMESYSTWCVSARFGSWMSSQKICTQMSSLFCMIIWYFLVLHLAVFGLFRIALSKRRAEKKEKIRKVKQFFLLQAANSFANSFTKHSKRKYLICVESGNAYRHGLAMDLRGIHFPQERARS